VRFQVAGIRLLVCCLLSAGAVLPLAAEEPTAGEGLYRIDLPTALRLARADNLDVKLAEERINEARAEYGSAVARFLPWLTAGVAFRRHEGRTQAVDGTLVDVDKQSTTFGPTITAQVDVGDAMFMSLAAKQTIHATQAALLARQQDSALAAATGYFELLKARAVVETNRDALAASRDYEQQLQGGVDAGVIFKGDLLRVQTQTQRYQAAVIQAQQQQRLAAARLADVLHLDPAIELVPREDDLVPIALVREQSAQDLLFDQALQARPELQQSQAQLQAAREAGRNTVYGPLIPSVGMQAFFGELGGGPGSAGGNFGHSRDYMVGLSWRLGPGGLFDFSRVKGARSKVASAELAVEKVSSTIRRQVVEAQARVQGSADQMAASRQALDSAQETLRLTRERKQLGVGIVLEDIQAQQELVRARTEYLGAITSFNEAQYELSKALGTL